MTGRKPPGVSSETWIDLVIKDARERGEFDNLPGEGKPIADLGRPHDELWWVRQKLKSEGVSFLPPTLALRKDREDTLALVDKATTEARVRKLLTELNARIIHVNRTSMDGPPSTVMPLDVEEAVAGWREKRTQHLQIQGVAETPGSTGAVGQPVSGARKSRLGRLRKSR